MEKVVSKLAMLGVPGLVLLVAISASGYAGGAAIITALVAIGPGGIIGGIVTLALIGMVTEAIAEFGFEVIFKAVLKELYAKGTTKSEILEKINNYPITKGLKFKLKNYVEQFDETDEAGN